MAEPYHVYGGLQDNSSWTGDSSYPGGVTNSRWENIVRGDGSGPGRSIRPRYIYAERREARSPRQPLTHESRAIKPYPRYGRKETALN